MDVDAAEPATRWFEFEGDPREHYLARMEFVPGSDEVMIQRLNRAQNTDWVFYGNIRTMELTPVLTETDEAFLDVHDDIVWLEDGKRLETSLPRIPRRQRHDPDHQRGL